MIPCEQLLQTAIRARPNTRETRQRMGRLTDTKVRGFMVTETNNDACAQLQPVPSHASPFAHTLHSDPASHPLVALYPKLVHFYRFHKARKREVNLRSTSKSTPDPPDACSNERAQTPPLTRNARNIHKDIYRRYEWNTSVKTKTTYI